MNRRFKERLIGAVVLVGAAVVILPAVLNGPRTRTEQPVAEAAGQPTNRSETIELEARAATQPSPAAALVQSSEAPSAADPPTGRPSAATPTPSEPVATEQQAAPTLPATASPATASPAPAVTSATSVSTAVPQPTATPPSHSTEASPRRAAAPAEATGWAVQVGNFASQANAQALEASLKARGYAAFISSHAGGAKTYFRVRVGPTTDIEAARALEQRLEKDGQSADVVRNP